ncbi:MAG: hypothetical protein II092_07100, partial [Lachnospiraceae bacterium]|nr:hypothetical protein [Lachnospiraceae bacterium]
LWRLAKAVARWKERKWNLIFRDLGFYFMNIMMPEMVYTICVMIPLYFVFEAVIRRLDQTDNKRSTRKIG